jgi:hypothetical protein
MATKTPSIEPLPANLFWESALADRLGISRTAVRLLRKQHLTTEDWRFQGNAVVLTAAGLAKIEAALGGAVSTPTGEEARAEANGGAAADVPRVMPGPPPKRHFVVLRIPVHRVDAPQKKLLIARPVPADFAPCAAWEVHRKLAGLVHSPELRERPVLVRDNTNFRPGMVFEAVSIGTGMWQFAGRLPRRPGRW